MKIGFLGAGAMGGALLDGAVNNQLVKAKDVYVYDISPVIQEKYQAKGVNVLGSARDLAVKSDLVFLAVKPHFAKDAIAEFEGELKGKAVISVMAGKTNAILREMLGDNVRILRVMPNIPALVGAGCFALCDENTLKPEEREFADKLFKSMGTVEWLSEELVDVAAGFTGAIPAFTAMFIEGLTQGAVLEGIPWVKAYDMATQAVLGSAELLSKTKMHPAQLKDMVCSPKGATIEGIRALEHGDFKADCMEAIIATYEKAKKL
ncbi:MAG: pyrroline-5-carboxylate reductase [Erysipelotrichaceae bacterium]|nr:pyrroline-5-carboxylate reductase [Erysipelotrichaceae bacterium]